MVVSSSKTFSSARRNAAHPTTALLLLAHETSNSDRSTISADNGNDSSFPSKKELSAADHPKAKQSTKKKKQRSLKSLRSSKRDLKVKKRVKFDELQNTIHEETLVVESQEEANENGDDYDPYRSSCSSHSTWYSEDELESFHMNAHTTAERFLLASVLGPMEDEEPKSSNGEANLWFSSDSYYTLRGLYEYCDQDEQDEEQAQKKVPTKSLKKKSKKKYDLQEDDCIQLRNPKQRAALTRVFAASLESLSETDNDKEESVLGLEKYVLQVCRHRQLRRLQMMLEINHVRIEFLRGPEIASDQADEMMRRQCRSISQPSRSFARHVAMAHAASLTWQEEQLQKRTTV